MLLDTADIPQADQIWDVARVPEAIDRGRLTTEAIAEYIGMKVLRQGHYYTQAARILGLVAEGEPGDDPQLTILGRSFARSNRAEQRTYLRRLLLQRDPMRAVIVAMRMAPAGLERTAVAQVLQGLAPLADSTAYRRAQTVAAWLTAVDLADWRDGRLFYTGPDLPMPSSTPSASGLIS
ncbi:DUF7226 domain-containing protein [Candidatus Chloroploca asiatica]|uniref:DUF7226 domain-containing protein n=1 Tax=Candidatus Chloroploca asiatica TaxID=1506545 RepID=A0A2H3L159_9CHLR|nr:hypothetical protein [Candidatus Chloroploca asiatica]PDV96887.1 hypothetical protein A9Q02_19975 [Candidatus Chloroploca asiatica]